MRLKGRIAVITGAGSGIGRASALLFAAEGALVALVDRDSAGMQETLAAVRAAKGEGSEHSGDVGDGDFAKATVEAVVSHHGRLDVLMTAAGWSCGGTVVTTDPADWDAVFRTHVGGTWLWSRAAVPQMQRQGGGSIVTLASQLAIAGGTKQQRLYRRQGRNYQSDENDGCGFCSGRNSRQCDRARRHRHADAAAKLRPACRSGAGP